MTSTEARLKSIEDRQALEDVLTAYCTAIDSLSDMDGLLGCFTDDAVMDLSGINLPEFRGHEEIRGFFQQVFDDMSHHAHFVSNFKVERLEGDTAYCTAYVMGMGRSHKGQEILVYVRYYLDMVRTSAGWKMSRFSEDGLMPVPDVVAGVHGRD